MDYVSSDENLCLEEMKWVGGGWLKNENRKDRGDFFTRQPVWLRVYRGIKLFGDQTSSC